MNQEPINKERPVPQAYSKQAIHVANVMDLSNPTHTTDTSAHRVACNDQMTTGPTAML